MGPAPAAAAAAATIGRMRIEIPRRWSAAEYDCWAGDQRVLESSSRREAPCAGRIARVSATGTTAGAGTALCRARRGPRGPSKGPARASPLRNVDRELSRDPRGASSHCRDIIRLLQILADFGGVGARRAAAVESFPLPPAAPALPRRCARVGRRPQQSSVLEPGAADQGSTPRSVERVLRARAGPRDGGASAEISDACSVRLWPRVQVRG